MRGNSLDKGVSESPIDLLLTPRRNDLRDLDSALLALNNFEPLRLRIVRQQLRRRDFFAIEHHPSRSVPDNILHKLEEPSVVVVFSIAFDVRVNFHHTCVDNTHVHTSLHSVVKERSVHRFADLVDATESEREVAHTAADLAARAQTLDLTARFDEVTAVIVVLRHAGRDGEDVRVENDVTRREAYTDHDVIRALADPNFILFRRRLSFLVESHDDGRGTVILQNFRLFNKERFSLFQRDTVADALALDALQPGFDNLKLGRIDHERHFRNVRLRDRTLQELLHRNDAVDHAVVDVDVDDHRSVLDLLASDLHRSGVIVVFNQTLELARSCHRIINIRRKYVSNPVIIETK